MSTAAIVWVIVAIVVVAVVAAIITVRTKQRRAQASARMGLPDIGALSGTTDTKIDKTKTDPTTTETRSTVRH